MESEKRYGKHDISQMQQWLLEKFMFQSNMDGMMAGCITEVLSDYQALEAERDELKQYVDDLLDRPTYAGEYEQLRKASHIMAENYRSLEAELEELRAAVEEYVAWHGPSCDDHAADEDPECEVCQKDTRLSQALKGGGDE